MWPSSSSLAVSVYSTESFSRLHSGAADVKELIPEFYMPGGDFLINSLGLDLGVCQDGAKVSTSVL